MEMDKIYAQAVKAIKGEVPSEFSKSQQSDALRAAFIELNGGSDKLSPKTFRRGNQLFELIEELVPIIVEEGFNDDHELFNLVEYRNIKFGDVNEFYTEGELVFTVEDAAAGIRGVRRQRLNEGDKIVINTAFKVVRVYENLGRLLAGRVSFDKFVTAVATSFKKQILADIYNEIANITAETAGLSSTYVKSGTFDEDTLLELIEHIEAATGKTVTIYGTKAALRKVTTAQIADEQLSDLYNIGFYGKFYGTPMVSLKQVHAVGTDDFILDNDKLYLFATDDKPVKVVNEGEGLFLDRGAELNNDLTQEYIYGQAMGTGVICAQKMGVYTLE